MSIANLTITQMYHIIIKEEFQKALSIFPFNLRMKSHFYLRTKMLPLEEMKVFYLYLVFLAQISSKT